MMKGEGNNHRTRQVPCGTWAMESRTLSMHELILTEIENGTMHSFPALQC